VSQSATTIDPSSFSTSDTGAAVLSDGLTKRFGRQVAVDHVDLRVPAGAVYGFLGPNGSGKTTTIRMLLGLIRSDAGSCTMLGVPVSPRSTDVLARVGALVEGPAFHPYLSGRANLTRLDAADRYADPATAGRRIGAALERVGLSAAADKKYRAYSLGMRQRLAIAGALLRPRELLILDEPTNGLDPQGTREVRHLVASLAEDGQTVLLSSHLLSEVEQVCDHLGVMSRGRLVAQGSLAELRASVPGAQVQITTPDTALAAEVLNRLGLPEVRHEGDHVRARLDDHQPEVVVKELVDAGVRVRDFRGLSATLEDLFVSLTGEGFNVSG
jgi:ABC-2 type transport system ATP-binding protein